MKKLFSMGAVALLALVFVGCSNNDIEGDGSGDKSSKLATIKLTLPGDVSRINYEEDSQTGGLKVRWQEGDKIGVYSTYDDTTPDEFTIKSGVGDNEATFEGKFSEDYEGLFIVAYPYTPGKSADDIRYGVNLESCQDGTLASMGKYDALCCMYDEEETTNRLTHGIAVVKVTTPDPSSTGQAKVGIRGAWQPGFTYYANSTSNTTYIAVPKSVADTKDMFVAVYDNNQKCKLYKKSREAAAGIETGEMATVDVSSVTPYEYDCDGLIENHEYVNMGNGIGMATMNIGANSPTGYGYYFRFGEQNGWKVEGLTGVETSEGKKEYYADDNTFKVNLMTYTKETPYTNCLQYSPEGRPMSRSYVSGKTFYDNGNWGLIDQPGVTDFQGQTNLMVNNTKYGDAARYNWGGNWMVMNSNIAEEWTKTAVNETTLHGYNLTNNNRTVFLPAACHCVGDVRQGEYGGTGGTDPHYCGHYWSTLTNDAANHKAWYWNFILGRVDFGWTQDGGEDGGRHGGFSVRPIISLSSTSN